MGVLAAPLPPPWLPGCPPKPFADPLALLDPATFIEPARLPEPLRPPAPPTPLEPATDWAPPELVAPPAALDPPLPPVEAPLPCKVVTLDASRATVSAPFEAITVPSFAKLLLEDVVYFA